MQCSPNISPFHCPIILVSPPPPPYDDISYDDGGGMSQLHFEKTEGEGEEESVSLAHMSAAAESGLKPISLSDKDVLETRE